MTITCPRCQQRRIVKAVRKTDVCQKCRAKGKPKTRKSHGLPPGNWRLNPFTRRQEYVYDKPQPKPAPEPKQPYSGPPKRTNETIDHGTDRGYKQHHRAGIPYCRPCRKAHLEVQAAREIRRYEAGDPKFACPECGGRKNAPSKRCIPCGQAARRGISQPHNQRKKAA